MPETCIYTENRPTFAKVINKYEVAYFLDAVYSV